MAITNIQNKLTVLICGLTSKPSDLSFRFTIQNKLTVLICGLTSKPSDLSFRFTIKKSFTSLRCKTFFILCIPYCFAVFFPVRVIFFICIGIYFSRQSHIPPNKKSWLISFSYKLTTDF